MLGLFHLQKRKRIYKKGEPFPHPDPVKRMVDVVIYIVGILAPLMAIPQMLKIWIEKAAEGVSLFSWSALLVSAIIWLLYGLLHREKPLIITYVLWIIVDALIVLGIFLYQ